MALGFDRVGRTEDKAGTSWGQRGSLSAFDGSGLPREGAVQGKITAAGRPRAVLTPFLPLGNGMIMNQRHKPWRRIREGSRWVGGP